MASKIVVLVGPIDYWWNENWHTDQHVQYLMWRNDISRKLVESGYLVYRPHEAFKGAWNEAMQDVNYKALTRCDIVIDMRPEGVPAYGTEKELEYVRDLIENLGYSIQIFKAPPGDWTEIAPLIKPLKDPYSTVHRKSYSKA